MIDRSSFSQAVRRRFDKRIYIPLPDLKARQHMFKVSTKKLAKRAMRFSQTCNLETETFDKS